jgi:mitochondrial import inner membrane translocase subunit TIM16
MAVGPIARLLAQVIVPVIAIVARSLPAAYAQALQNAKKNGTAAAASESSLLRKVISRSEALQILNLTESEATVEAVQRQYEKYMAANAVKPGTGGSFYLQSKVYRANELLSDFTKQQQQENQTSTSEKQ